jgi:hypothetical protein
MPALLTSLGSYYTPSDGYRHAIVATSDGEVHEIFFNPKTGRGNATLACFCGLRFLTAFYTADDQMQHPVVATATGDIFEVYYKPGSFHISGLIANFANIIGISGFYAGDDHNRICIVGTADGAVHEVFWSAAIGAHVTQPALATFPSLRHLSAFYTDNDKNRHVIVATADGNITEVWYSPTVGIHITQPPLGKFPNVVSIAAFYTADDQISHVVVAQADGSLTELFYNSSIGVHQTRPALTVLPNTIAISAFYSPDDKTSHVIAVDTRGNVTEVFYSAAGISVTQPPLANFPDLSPIAEYIGPDVTNIDSVATSNAASSSPSGRCIALAGDSSRLHAFSDSGGIWSSSMGSSWILETSSPAPSLGEGATVTVLAVSPINDNRVLACNQDGLWETTNGGSHWSKLFDPSTVGLSSAVSSVGFDSAGRVFAAVSDGVAIQQAQGMPFQISVLNTTVLAVAVSETKVWARTQSALFVSNTQNISWSGPFTPPATLILAAKEHVQLAATDDFAFMVTTVPGSFPGNPNGCASNNVLVVFTASTSGWSAQEVVSSAKLNWQKAQNVPKPESFTCQGSGGDQSINGRQFIKCIHLNDPTLPNVVGQQTQLIFGSGQEVWRAISQNADGTVPDWDWAVGTTGLGFTNRDPVHADIWDFHLDTVVGGRTAWVACDGGIYKATVGTANYQFTGVTWQPSMEGLETHQIKSLTMLRTDPVSRPRVAYVIQDNSAFFQDTTALAMQPAAWQSFTTLGDGNFSAGDSSVPTFAWLARQLNYEYLLQFASPPVFQNAQLVNASPPIDPSIPTRFRFVPSPREDGLFSSVDVVMMVELPLLDASGNAFSTQPGANSKGQAVLVRNHTFEQNAYINAANAQGKGWTLERATLPANCAGFAVCGKRSAPVYYAFDGSSVFAERNGSWTVAVPNVVSSRLFGPVFPNPYDVSVVFVLTSDQGVRVSSNGGSTFPPDAQLNKLLPSGAGDVNQISFNYENPAAVVVGTETGRLLFSRSPGVWNDLTGILPTPLIPIRSIAIDCRSIYIGTLGRGLWQVRHYGSA